MNFDEKRTDPEPTETIQVRLIMTVNKRPDYQAQIANICECAIGQFKELKKEGMTSPLKVFIEIAP